MCLRASEGLSINEGSGGVGWSINSVSPSTKQCPTIFSSKFLRYDQRKLLIASTFPMSSDMDCGFSTSEGTDRVTYGDKLTAQLRSESSSDVCCVAGERRRIYVGEKSRDFGDGCCCCESNTIGAEQKVMDVEEHWIVWLWGFWLSAATTGDKMGGHGSWHLLTQLVPFEDVPRIVKGAGIRYGRARADGTQVIIDDIRQNKT